MGTPWAIPGRIEFENYDDGGEGVGWRVDDSTGNFGQGGCAGNDLRMGVHPQICRSNTSMGENDLYSMGPLMGTHYPSDAMPQSYYLGYAHPSDWVKLTVNVATAGTYKVSSTWASDPGGASGSADVDGAVASGAMTGAGGATGEGGATGTAGTAAPGASGDRSSAPAPAPGGAGTQAGSPEASGSGMSAANAGGCACTLDGGANAKSAAVGALMAGLVALVRRRRSSI